MRTLYLECNMGAAGDMLMAALLELHPDKEDFVRRLNQAGIPDVTIEALPGKKCGISGTHMKVEIAGQEEGEHHHGHEHHEGEHHHDHEHHTHHHTHEDHEAAHGQEHHSDAHHSHGVHTHMSMQEIMNIVDGLQIPEAVKTDVKNIYTLLAQAEGQVHGTDVTKIHFHEVGMMDAIADITGCVMLIHELKIEKIISSPINVGFGQVKCAHGILPVPAPATALLLEGIPCYGGRIEGELCTPTGAALIQYFAKEYGRIPEMTIEKIGYGLGKKDFEAANCIRAILGKTKEEKNQIAELCCNLDDMTAEELGYATELLMEKGALDVFTTAIGMKKGRPGVLLTVLCSPEDKEKLAELLFKHTTTIGIRESYHNRMVMERTQYSKKSEYGDIRMKKCTGYGVSKEKPEYEDLKRIADETGMSLLEIKRRGGL